jgi:ATP-dependent DNA helicase RecQ
MEKDSNHLLGLRVKKIQQPKASSRIDEHSGLATAKKLVRHVWGFADLRPLQRQVLDPLLQGRDTLAVLPTGAGKSLCYVLPALMGQVKIAAAALDSMQSQEERSQVLGALKDKRVKILFVSPERFSLKAFRVAIDPADVRMIAVDEAHCISQWGFHFRPEYRRLLTYMDDFPGAVRLALTATTTAKVRKDILDCLGLRRPAQILAPPTRENLKLKVESFSRVNDLQPSVIQTMGRASGSGIIYCPTRRGVSELYAELLSKGVPVVRYHGGLSSSERDHAQREFLTGNAQIAVATNAFGMGIDKSDIRFVYHCGLPQSLEHYLQEVGRAGRDGLPATCILFFCRRDYHIQKFILDKSFVDVEMLRNGYRETSRLVDHEEAVPFQKIADHLYLRLKCSKEDSELVLGILIREGVYLREEEFPLFPEEDGQVMIRRNKEMECDKAFFDRYSKRKAGIFAALGSMLNYAEGGRGRQSILDKYFN